MLYDTSSPRKSNIRLPSRLSYTGAHRLPGSRKKILNPPPPAHHSYYEDLIMAISSATTINEKLDLPELLIRPAKINAQYCPYRR